MNKMKKEQIFPSALHPVNITSLFKKGQRKDYNCYRGICRPTVFRAKLDGLTYNDNYDTIDENLTDSNVGARKKRNIRDNLFVLNAITNSVVNGKEAPVQVQVLDVEKCFDKMSLHNTTNALYDAGLQNDDLSLLYAEDENAEISIKTHAGLTQRVNVKNVVMQGTKWANLKCTTTMDILGKNAYDDETLQYKYWYTWYGG